MQEEDPCTTCGSGDSTAICSCSKCGDRAHLWCMRTVLKYIPATWVCDECQMRNSKISLKQVRDDRSHPGPSAVPSERSPTQLHIRKKDAKDRKVKYLPESEAALLLPNDARNGSMPINNTFRKKQRTPRAFKTGSPVKPSPPVKDFHELTEHLRETKQSKAMGKKIAGTEKPSKPQDSLKIPGNGLCEREDKRHEHESINGVLAKEMTIFEKFTKNPVCTEAIWSGQFEILNGSDHGVYGGLQAYAPCLIHRKAYFLSLMLPSSLSFNITCRSDLWVEFVYGPPDEEDVSLYILPENMDRCQQQYKHLVEMLDSRDQAMHANIDGVELIIFTSRWLKVDCKEIFLWGSYRCVSKYVATEKESGLAPVIDGDNLDMELDMVDGEWIGGPEEVIVNKERIEIGLESSERLRVTEKRNSEELLEFPPGFEQHYQMKKRKVDAAAAALI
uniref:AIPP2-like SPOC-like domain-containing protein n=1 Tax=Kalanchoe fedtschenkoi TaxID=63787 RepID=A0A7N0T193_KALFE